MKKVLLVIAIFIPVGLLFVAGPFNFVLQQWTLLVPIMAGVFMVLVQNEDRSYRFLPKLIVGSLLGSFLFFLLVELYFWNGEGPLLQHFFSIEVDAPLILASICFWGGLIGISLKGIRALLTENKHKRKK